MARSSLRFTIVALAGFAAMTAAIAGFVAAVDPYWLWRERVAWSGNPALENRMRFAKSLQILLRQPDIVLLGSSVIYRGMDPDDIQGSSAYNLGIASLRIREAEAYVRYLLKWVRPKQIVIGIDFFAFDQAQPFEAGFDSTLTDFGYPLKAGIGAFVSATALSDAWRLARHPRDDSDGTWHRNGFKNTRPRSSDEIEETLKMTRILFSTSEIARSELTALEGIVELARRENVQLLLFVPPYHRAWIDASREARRRGLDFDEWIGELTTLARRQGIEVWEFASTNPVAAGSIGIGSRYYLDPSHFSPIVGQWILSRLGLNVRLDEAPPDGFGRRLSVDAFRSRSTASARNR